MGIGGREARDEVDQARRPPRIEVSRDGPYRVTGGGRLLDENGTHVARNEGASLKHYSLCRCGHSRNMPFCSGRHREVNFADPPIDRDRLPTLFEWAGGLPAFNRLARRFYETYVPADPLLAPLFARMAPDHPERVAAWIAEVFGGPGVYSGNYGGFLKMMTSHLGRHFTEAQRARFVRLLCQSADDVGLPADPEFRGAFVAYLEWGSRIAMETSQPGARPPRNMQMPRWEWIRDAVPGSRPPSFAQHEKRPEVIVPGPDEPVRFAVHIRPLFRKMDRRAMSYAFDLWDVASARAHAAAILTRIEDGTMPVDGPWPPEAVQLLRRWIVTGMGD
jgi:truncated hemoglobin YjbI/CDGSH-type Zn-finger protein